MKKNKAIITNYIKSFYHKIGFFPPERILSAEAFKNQYPTLSNRHKKEMFNKYIEIFKNYNDHNRYNKLLQIFINDKLPDGQFEYLPNSIKGASTSSFSVFRKTKMTEFTLFEKVYYSEHDDYKRMEYFYQFIYPLIKEKINIPKQIQICGGDTISVVYFEYLDLKKHDFGNEFLKEINKYPLFFYNESSKSQYLNKINDIDFQIKYHYLFDFSQHSDYIKQAHKINLEGKYDFEKLESLIGQSKRVLTHGDIHYNNIFKNNVLIDWDNFGFYPIGYDSAFIFQRLLWINKINEDLDTWLKDYYQKHIAEEDWKEFKRNVYFFVWVLNFSRSNINKKLSSQLNKYFENISTVDT